MTRHPSFVSATRPIVKRVPHYGTHVANWILYRGSTRLGRQWQARHLMIGQIHDLHAFLRHVYGTE